MRALMTETQNGRATTEVTAPPVAAARALIPHSDTREVSALVIDGQSAKRTTPDTVVLPPLTPMEVATLGMRRMAEFLDDFRARFDLRLDRRREAEAQDLIAVEELCGSCGLYPARLEGQCVGCVVRGAMLQRCTSCRAVLVDEARCSSCGAHQ